MTFQTEVICCHHKSSYFCSNVLKTFFTPFPRCLQHTDIDMNKSSAVSQMGDRGHNRHGPKRGGNSCAPFAGGAESPSNTMWPGPRSTSVPSGIFIHPTGWPQQTRTTNWGSVPFLRRKLGSHLAECGLDQGPPPCQVPS